MKFCFFPLVLFGRVYHAKQHLVITTLVLLLYQIFQFCHLTVHYVRFIESYIDIHCYLTVDVCLYKVPSIADIQKLEFLSKLALQQATCIPCTVHCHNNLLRQILGFFITDHQIYYSISAGMRLLKSVEELEIGCCVVLSCFSGHNR